ncbi:MAG: M56 family metallopeptidase [Acidobacteriaceae bacterium]
MFELACAGAAYAVHASWEIPLLSCAGWLASRLLRRCGPRAEHVVWVATFMLCLLAPALPFGQGLFAGGLAAGGGTSVSIVTGASTGTALFGSGAMLLPVWAIWALFGAWVGSVLVFSGRLLWAVRQTAALVGDSGPALLPAEAASQWERGQRAFGVRGASIRRSEHVHGVVTAGWRRPLILVAPHFVERCSGDDFLSAMGHELAHIERRDYAKNLFCEAAGLAVAFHPVMRLVKARIAQTREMICDELAVERLVEARTYRRSLVRLAQQMIAARSVRAHALGIFDANILEKRIMSMKKERPVVSGFARWVLTGCAVVLLAATAASGVLAKGVAADQGASYGKVYHPGPDVTNPKLVYAPDPEYPKNAAARARTHVICVIRVIVDRDGVPQDLQVVQSGGKDFDAEATKAVGRYRFEPGLRNGKPVAVEINIEVNFRKY